MDSLFWVILIGAVAHFLFEVPIGIAFLVGIGGYILLHVPIEIVLRHANRKYPIIYREVTIGGLAKHVRQHFRRGDGKYTWLLIKSSAGHRVTCLKYYVPADPAIHYYVIPEWVKRSTPDYYRYAESFEEVGEPICTKAVVDSDYLNQKYPLLDNTYRVKKLEPYMDRLVVECGSEDTAFSVIQKAFELAHPEGQDVHYLLRVKGGFKIHYDFRVDGTMTFRKDRKQRNEINKYNGKYVPAPAYIRGERYRMFPYWCGIFFLDTLIGLGKLLIGRLPKKPADPDWPDTMEIRDTWEHNQKLPPHLQ